MNVTITQLQNGTTADATVVNANLNALAAAVNGGIDATNITPGSLTESLLAAAIQPHTYLKQITVPFVVSGLTIATSGSLSTTIASGTAIINGKEVTLSGTPLTVSASKDTYIDIKDDGTVVAVAVANNVTSGMTLTTNSDGSNALRIAKVVSSGSAIVQVLQNAANSSPVSPNTLNWFGFDPLGNPVYNGAAQLVKIGYAETTVAQNTISTETDLTNLSIPVVVPPGGRDVKITAIVNTASGSAGSLASLRIKEGSTVLKAGQYAMVNTANAGTVMLIVKVSAPTAGAHTYKLSLAYSAGTGNAYADTSGFTNSILAELD